MCNGHTTCTDVLWSGVPILTRQMEPMCSRVAGSLACAVGCPEMCVNTMDEYVARAVRLGTQRSELLALRRKLWHNRNSAPLFNTQMWTREWEAGLHAVWERHRTGLPPDHLDVPPLGADELAEVKALNARDAEARRVEAKVVPDGHVHLAGLKPAPQPPAQAPAPPPPPPAIPTSSQFSPISTHASSHTASSPLLVGLPQPPHVIQPPLPQPPLPSTSVLLAPACTPYHPPMVPSLVPHPGLIYALAQPVPPPHMHNPRMQQVPQPSSQHPPHGRGLSAPPQPAGRDVPPAFPLLPSSLPNNEATPLSAFSMGVGSPASSLPRFARDAAALPQHKLKPLLAGIASPSPCDAQAAVLSSAATPLSHTTHPAGILACASGANARFDRLVSAHSTGGIPQLALSVSPGVLSSPGYTSAHPNVSASCLLNLPASPPALMHAYGYQTRRQQQQHRHQQGVK